MSNLETEQKLIPQVYLPGYVLDSETRLKWLFQGRQEWDYYLNQALRSNVSFTICGQRGIGKSSLLHYLIHKTVGLVTVVFIDCTELAGATTLDEFAVLLSQAIARALSQNSLPLLDSDAFQSAFAALHYWLEEIEDVISTKLWFCFDQFEQLKPVIEATGVTIPDFFRSWTFQSRASFWFTLIGHPNDFPQWKEAFINPSQRPLSYLDDLESVDVILNPLECVGCNPQEAMMLYPMEVIDYIVNLTRGYPYLLQLTCSEIINYLSQIKKQSISVDELKQLMPQILQAGLSFFDQWWNDFPIAEQRVLISIAQGQQVDGKSSEVQRLIRKEVLELEGNALQFYVPLIQHYVQYQGRA